MLHIRAKKKYVCTKINTYITNRQFSMTRIALYRFMEYLELFFRIQKNRVMSNQRHLRQC